MLLCRYLAGMMLALVYRWFLMPDSLGHLLYTSQTARTASSNSQNSEEHISGKCLRSQICGLITISSSPNGLHLSLSRSVQKLSSARFRRGRRGGRACLLLPTFCRGAERREKIVDEAHRIDSVDWTGLDWTDTLPKYLQPLCSTVLPRMAASARTIEEGEGPRSRITSRVSVCMKSKMGP